MQNYFAVVAPFYHDNNKLIIIIHSVIRPIIDNYKQKQTKPSSKNKHRLQSVDIVTGYQYTRLAINLFLSSDFLNKSILTNDVTSSAQKVPISESLQKNIFNSH